MRINRQSITNATKKTYLGYIKLFPVLQKERSKQYGMLIFTFVTMIFFGIFAINPTLTTIAELQRKLTDARFVEAELARKISNLSRLQNQYTQLTPDLETILSAVPEKAQAPLLVGQLNAIANQSGVTLDGLTIGELMLASATPIQEGNFTFSMQVTGTFAQVEGFLTTLSDFERIVVIDSLAITKQSISAASMTIAIEGTAHFRE